AVQPGDDMLVQATLSEFANTAYAFSQKVRIGGDRAAISGGGKILTGMETEAGQITETACGTMSQSRTMSLSRIFDDSEAVLPGNRQQGSHGSRLAVQMHWNDTFGVSRYYCVHLRCIHQKGIFVGID